MKQASPPFANNDHFGPKLHCTMVGLAIIILTVGMRLAVVCGLPSTDEGFYAFYSMLVHNSLSNGQGLPPLGTLQIYPILCSGIFGWSGNPLIALRLCDMIVASIMSWQLYRLLLQTSGSLLYGGLLAALTVIAVNMSLFIQYGFKNALFAAWIPLLISLRLGLAASGKQHRVFFLCGSLVALSIFLRESFAPFAFLGVLAIFLSNGWRKALLFTAGGVVTAIIGLGIASILRGGPLNIIEAYVFFSKMAVSVGSLTSASMLYLNLSLKEIVFWAPLGVILLIALLYNMHTKQLSWGFLFFWFVVALAPLAETLTKGAYPYHFSTVLIGASGMLAYVTHQWKQVTWQHILFLAACFTSVSLTLPCLTPVTKQAATSLQQLGSMLSQPAWPEQAKNSSNYLLMADKISATAHPGATLDVSGGYYVVHVLTGLLPPKRTQGHLFDVALYGLIQQLTPQQLTDYIRQNPSDIFLVSDRPGFGTENVKTALVLLPEYKAYATISHSPSNNYGSFTGTIFVKERAQ